MSFRQTHGIQQTLSCSTQIAGKGLFHGVEAKVRLCPAEPDTGIVFHRIDLRQRPEVAAHIDNVTSAPRRTVVASRSGAVVETIEHLMAAFAGLQVDNCLVEIDSIEVPAVDGSCLPFCEAILAAGLTQQSGTRSLLTIEESQCANDRAGEQWIEIIPSYDGTTSIDYWLDYGTEAPISSQSFSVELTPETFLQEIASARTFVLEEEIDALRQMGFGLHLTSRDLLVFDTNGTVIDNTLRWNDEPVRHKILDCIGDLALSGQRFAGRVVARRSGHKLNHVMAKTLSTIETCGSVLRAA
ncbi:MAG TPA: UDP-3-O-acyl-N-acetylglucosamine deacetylase [Planctomycetaceae bacterium]|nr:UDP-3-O-acyl-N-acetylglucosamine deacetylase [Planctomycetaceae bacterium]HQZ67886.1 UDP-3-O-acyl-N-acetylglucosamine deacetylase [Planctomycetaceae bacterium]HRA88352.1 UDP-3-O-acyl-N-acetylglucosamine deacetylase [Planctomycetaceae bacterium]